MTIKEKMKYILYPIWDKSMMRLIQEAILLEEMNEYLKKIYKSKKENDKGIQREL